LEFLQPPSPSTPKALEEGAAEEELEQRALRQAPLLLEEPDLGRQGPVARVP